MKKKIVLAGLLIISFYSCTDNNPIGPAKPREDYSKADLATQLAHYIYMDDYYYVQFFPDGSFVEQINTNLGLDGELVRLCTRYGKYKLEGSLIKVSDIQIDYNSELGGVSIIWSDKEVYLDGGVIAFRSVTVLEAENYKNELWNSWKTIKQVFHYVDSPEVRMYNGREEYFYEFISADQKVKWGHNFLDESPWSGTVYHSEFKYEPPLLYLKSMVEQYEVEFKNNKMYWYYKPFLGKTSRNTPMSKGLYPELISFR